MSITIDNRKTPTAMWIRWRGLCRKMDVDETVALQGFAMLVEAYGRANGFHTLDSVRHNLIAANAVDAVSNDAEMAIWLRNSVYGSSYKHRRRLSAEFGARIVIRLGLADHSTGIIQPILGKRGRLKGASHDTAIVHDACSCILGASWGEYDLYRQRIRRDFGAVEFRDFQTLRLDYLTRLEDSSRIFYTSGFYLRYENQARANIARERGLIIGDSIL